MKFYIYTLGCKVNTYESQVVHDMLINNGFIEDENADIFIINTCTVTNTSDSKSLKVVRQCQRKNPNAIIVVMGCMTQVSSSLVKDMQGVSIVIGNMYKSKIPELINEYLKTKKQIIKVDNIMAAPFEDMILNNFNRTRAFVKIEDGCENYCTYCIIPYSRGKVRSKQKEKVIEEITNLVKEGHKEIVLTGIHTGHYGADLENYSFAQLLKEIENIEGLERLRISSIEITELDEEFMQILKTSKKLVDHMHIPLQAGSDEILSKMNRKYNLDYYFNKINEIRTIRPNMAISTDVIVGFPGETEELFIKTIETCRKLEFSKIHVFPFSLRKGTKAEELSNHIDEAEKKRRSRRLIEVSKELEIKYMEKFIGQDILFIPEVEHDGYLIGHTGNYLEIKAKGNKELLHKDVLVTIDKVEYPYVISTIKNN